MDKLHWQSDTSPTFQDRQINRLVAKCHKSLACKTKTDLNQQFKKKKTKITVQYIVSFIKLEFSKMPFRSHLPTPRALENFRMG